MEGQQLIYLLYGPVGMFVTCMVVLFLIRTKAEGRR